MDLITKDSDATLVLFSSLDRVLENVENMVTNYRLVLNGEHYLTGEEVCKKLCISKRTLQDYRDTGLLGYVQLPGKIIYRESDILELLDRHYRSTGLKY
ncbi:helix-turn-helix domain-containing protein [Parabacteroides pacaensis]|uniref:helix-turn-helix domain-containing protein n=1 Tax=Parabacteroides pacaensis TaxID=2086575 RepID=UPI000D0F76B8|nr:helix-turn-helix domain-containing protein [Parabacteroides pacaensis]